MTERTKPFCSHTTLLWRCRFVSHHDPHHNPINRDLAAELLTASKQEPFPTTALCGAADLERTKTVLPERAACLEIFTTSSRVICTRKRRRRRSSGGGGGGGGDPQLSCLQRLSALCALLTGRTTPQPPPRAPRGTERSGSCTWTWSGFIPQPTGKDPQGPFIQSMTSATP